MKSSPLKTAATVAGVSCVTLLIFSLVLLAVEGPAAVSSVVREWGAPRGSAERLHTRFDAALGWNNLRGVRLPDLYGPGASLTTDARGFRGRREIADRTPSGKFRVICSGDSFTLGYGVDDSQSWPAALEALDSRFETVNLGLGGYGVDQSYLRFIRDAAPLDYDLHVLAFTYVDFERMKSARFFGYAKPRVSAESGRLKIEPPPPGSAPSEPSRAARMLVAMHRLKTVRFFETLARRYALSADDARIRAAALAILEDLDKRARRTGDRFAAVYLPTLMDVEPTRLDALRTFLARETAARRIPFVDLTPEFRALESEKLERFFIDGLESPFLGADGHYTAAGNRFVARLLRARLPLPAER